MGVVNKSFSLKLIQSIKKKRDVLRKGVDALNT